MENQEILISTNYQQVLFYASTDTELSANQFRVLFYIATHVENVYISTMKEALNIKTNNLIADCIKKLIKNNYISRTKSKKLIKKGVPYYSYTINTEKPLLPDNLNTFFSDSYFKNIDEVFSYFFLKIPTTKKIDIAKNRKAIELLLYKDDYSIETIKKVIDYVSFNDSKSYNRPILLRKKFKELLKLSSKLN